MPKIIKDIKTIITNCATELFIEHGYVSVDMRMISKKSGIAVGTLYNYYNNKKQLYINILKESWKNTFIKLDAICDENIPNIEKLKRFITILYEDIELRKGLGRDLLHPSVIEIKEDVEINDLKTSLISKVHSLLNGICNVESFSKCSNVDIRLAESLLFSMLSMHEFHLDRKSENIDFLTKLITLYLK